MPRPTRISHLLDSINTGAALSRKEARELITYVATIEADDLRRHTRGTEGVFSVQEAVPPAVPREELPVRQYRVLRQANENWKEIESMMNTLGGEGWEVQDIRNVDLPVDGRGMVPCFVFIWRK
jgi:hypothetical protein